MSKSFLSGLLILVFILVIAEAAFPWGAATHAFIAKKIGRYYLTLDFQEIYGQLAPDLFNFNFELSSDPVLWAFTHGRPGNEGFMTVWAKAAYRNYQKALAFGFVAHNDVWGADFPAHHQAQTIPVPADFPLVPGEIEPGYIVIKAVALNSDPTLNGHFESIGLHNDRPDHFRLRLKLCHYLVEAAGDLIIRRVDQNIGQNLITAAVVRDRKFVELLIRALDQPEYNQALIENEAFFRRLMIQYGALMILPEFRAARALAESAAHFSLKLIRKEVGIEVQQEQAEAIAAYGLKKASQLCAQDYLPEIRKTIEKVRLELRNHNIRY